MHASRAVFIGAGLSILCVAGGHAFDITGTAPQVHFTGVTNSKFPALQAYFEAKMNGEVKAAFDTSIAKAKRQLEGYQDQKDLAQGMANANVYATNSGTLQGYQNYEHFAVSSGLMVGAQLPTLDVSAYSSLADDIKEKGDVYAGLGAGLSYVNVGLNCKFLVPGLYLNAKYGGLSMSIKGVSMDYKVFGVGANYKVLEPKSLVGLIKWRGISVGTGFYAQMNDLSLKVEPDTFETDAQLRQAVLSGATDAQDSTDKEAILAEMGYGKNDPDAKVLLSPVFKMNLEVATYTIPLEANTAIAFLWGLLNINAGVGMDLNFGNAKIKLEGESDANVKGGSASKVSFDKAAVDVTGGAESGPSFARLRAMTGVGLGLGPVKIDIPLIYYFNTGFAFGITGAVVW